jgi:hypothetical protein
MELRIVSHEGPPSPISARISTDVKLQFGLFNDCWLCRRCAEIKLFAIYPVMGRRLRLLLSVKRTGCRIANIF